MQEPIAEVVVTAERDLDPAIEDAYRRRAAQLWSYARRLGLDRSSAEDVMQDAFVRATRTGPRSIRDLDAWLFRVVHNASIDHLRASAHRGSTEIVDLHQGDGSDDHVWLWAEVDRLPQRQRALIYLRYGADLEFSTIGSILRITEGGARANCARALTQLRERMNRR